MTQKFRKPSTSALTFLTKRWKYCVDGCEKLITTNKPLQFTAEDLVRPTQEMLRADVRTARRYWGTLEVDDALKELKFEHLTNEGMPTITSHRLNEEMRQRKRQREGKPVTS